VNFTQELQNRVKNRKKHSLIDMNTLLEHFVIISYKVPVNRIKHLIPEPFKLWTFVEDNVEYALISAVNFKDTDFSLSRILQFIKFNFYQTNFRTYIIDKTNNSHCAWFFGTTLGSKTSLIPNKIWKMPWERGKYTEDIRIKNGIYNKYELEFKSKQGIGKVSLVSTTTKMKIHSGFTSLDEQLLILTHPVIGYYYLKNKEIGTYEIWHPKMDLCEGKLDDAYFELFNKLNLLDKKEMKHPHSVLIINEIEFDILLPPKKYNNGQQ